MNTRRRTTLRGVHKKLDQALDAANTTRENMAREYDKLSLEDRLSPQGERLLAEIKVLHTALESGYRMDRCINRLTRTNGGPLVTW